MKKTVRHHHNQVQMQFASNGTNQHGISLKKKISNISTPKMYKLNPVMRKYQKPK